MKRLVPLTALIIFLFTVSAFAEVRVIQKIGQAAYKLGRAWVPLNAGANIPVGAKISTGARSKVLLTMNGHRVTIGALSMVKVYENSVRRMEQTTRVGLQRGSVRVKVTKQQRVKTVFKVATPVATSSVRGSEKIITYGPSLGMTIVQLSGASEGENSAGGWRIITGWLRFKQKPGKSEPEPLLWYQKDKAIARIEFRNATDEEYEGRGFFYGEQVDDVYFDQQRTTENVTTANANIFLIWN